VVSQKGDSSVENEVRAISTIIILNHFKRKKEGLALKKLIEKQTDKHGIDVKISFDAGGLGVWGNYQQALQMDSKENEVWRMIIQDDMLFPRQALDKILHILKFAPEDPVSFYAPTNKAYKEAVQTQHRIIKTHTNFWTQCFLMPTNLVAPFLSFCEENVSHEYPYEDRRLCLFLQEHDIHAWCVVPGLVQHLGGFRSVMGFPGKVGKYFRYSNYFNPRQEVFNEDWTYQFDNPMLSNVSIDKSKMLGKKVMAKLYGWDFDEKKERL